MSYLSIDEQCISKIEKYVTKINELYSLVEHLSDIQIEDGFYGLALTQCLTNLYELVIKVSSEELSYKLMPILQKTKTTRNIASHDYDSINWNIIKRNCKSIIALVTTDYLCECQNICDKDKLKEKDYTVD